MNNGNQYEQHEMVITRRFPSGAQEFYCPTCGRRFILQWPPTYQRIILDPGDENAIHSSATAGITMQVNSTESPVDEEDHTDHTGNLDDPYLSLWAKYIDNNTEL